MGNDNCIDCLQVKNLEDKIKAIWKQIEKSEGQLKEQEKRISDLESDTNELKTQFKNIEKTLEKIDKKLDKLTEAPGQKWDKVTTAAVIAMVSTLVGMALGKLF